MSHQITDDDTTNEEGTWNEKKQAVYSIGRTNVQFLSEKKHNARSVGNFSERYFRHRADHLVLDLHHAPSLFFSFLGQKKRGCRTHVCRDDVKTA